MAKRPAKPPFPDSPGAWIACFRHRIQTCGVPASPEEMGRRIGVSGTTVRRWEANRSLPDDREIARISRACDLSPIQSAFLSLACTHTRVMPAPDPRAFSEYMRKALDVPYPAVLFDGLFQVRAWNSHVSALDPTLNRAFRREAHPLALMWQRDEAEPPPEQSYEELRISAVRIFWMATAMFSHRPEYGDLLRELACLPGFREMWFDLAFGCRAGVPEDPITFSYSLGGTGSLFKVYSRVVTFPPTYYLSEYHPDDARAREALEAVREQGPPIIHIRRKLHWVKSSNEC